MRLVFSDDTTMEWDGDHDDATTQALMRAYPWPTHRPWVRANMVVTVDGRAQAADGLTEGISSAEDKRVFAHLRADCDVVLVGAGTVRSEGYHALRPKPGWRDVRVAHGRSPAPRLAIVSKSLGFDLATDPFVAPVDNSEIGRPIIMTTADSPNEQRHRLSEVAEVVICGDDAVDPQMLIAALDERGLTRILCEGGPRLLGDLVDAGLVDELDLTVSPLLLRSPTGGLLDSFSPASRRRHLHLAHTLQAGSTLMLRYLFEAPVVPKP